MARYTGPRLKIMRALGCALPGLSRKSIDGRDYPPGQHGMRPKRKSGYGLHLIEKQKLRFNYGLSERQLQRLFREAKRSKSPTGEKLLELLEGLPPEASLEGACEAIEALLDGVARQ